MFRDTKDYGPNIDVSDNWFIWFINEDTKFVGRLEGANRNADVGVVVRPIDIVDRMRTGKYNFKYPGYKS